jgi:hypothetical protein
MNDWTELDNYYYKVTVELCPHVKAIKGVFHIKWEKGMVKAIQCPTFIFAVTTMKQAMEKVKFLTDNHPEDYFSSINIQYYKMMTL